MQEVASLFPSTETTAAPAAPISAAPKTLAPAAPTGLDPAAVNLTKAIRQQETGGDFSAVGKSGEYGAYQFEPGTWDKLAPTYGVSGVSLQNATPSQQNQVAYGQIKAWKDAGYNVGQIASMWNAGEGEPNAYTGTFSNGKPSSSTAPGGSANGSGVDYDVPGYAKAVANYYQQLKAATPAAPTVAAPAGQVTTGKGISDTASFLNNALDQYQTNGFGANANGGEGTKVGNAIGSIIGVAPGQGTLLGNILRLPEAAAGGLAKLPIAFAGNLAQAVTGAYEKAAEHGAALKGGNNPVPGAAGLIKLAGENNPLNQNTAAGQQFSSDIRGQDFVSKAAKTVGDLATIIGDPGDLIGNVGGSAEKVAQAYTSALPDTGVLGRVAGYIPKAARAGVEGAFLTPFLNGTTPTAKSTVINALAPAVLDPFLKGIGSLIIPKLGEAAGKKALSDIEASISGAHAPGDPGVTPTPGADSSVVSRVAKLKNDFISGMQKYIDNAPQGFKKGLDFATGKFSNIASREANAESALTGKTVAPKDNNLLNYLFDTGGVIDGVDEKGRPITQQAQAKQQGIIDEISPLLQKLYGSSNQAIDGTSIGDSIGKDIDSGKYDADALRNKSIGIKNDVLSDPSTAALRNPNATPADMYEVSKNLRSQAYKDTESYKNSQQPIDNVTARIKRDIAGKIDAELAKVKDVPPEATARIRNLQTRAYTAKDFLQHMETLKAPQSFTKTVGKAVGGTAGWASAGWHGAIIGAQGGAKLVSRLQQAFGDLNLSSDVMAKFTAKATADQVNELKTVAENSVSKNETSATERAANDAKIKAVLARTLPAPDLTVERPAQNIRRYDTSPAKTEAPIVQGAPAARPRLNAPGENPVPISSRFPQGNVLPVTGNVPGGYVEPPANTIRRYYRPDAVPQLNAPGQNPIPLKGYFEH